MQRHFKLTVLALVVLGLLVGCGGTAFKAVSASADLYEGAYPAFVDAHNKGLVNEADYQKGKSLAEKYWAAYHMAVEAGIAYKTVETKDAADRLQEALVQSQAALSAMIEYIVPLLPKGGK